MSAKIKPITCSKCGPKAPFLFSPSLVKKAMQGGTAVCRECVKKWRKHARIKSTGGNWRDRDKLHLPGGH